MALALLVSLYEQLGISIAKEPVPSLSIKVPKCHHAGELAFTFAKVTGQRMRTSESVNKIGSGQQELHGG
jgi:hypothetical protein